MILNTSEDLFPTCLLKGFYTQLHENLVTQSLMVDTRDHLSYTVLINLQQQIRCALTEVRKKAVQRIKREQTFSFPCQLLTVQGFGTAAAAAPKYNQRQNSIRYIQRCFFLFFKWCRFLFWYFLPMLFWSLDPGHPKS